MSNGYSPPVGVDAVLPNSGCEHYENKLLVLEPASLKEAYRFEEFQYFIAQSGFGCDPTKLGTKVFGRFLFDDEKAAFRRYDFMGVADPKKLPAWASEKLADAIVPNNKSIAMGGIE